MPVKTVSLDEEETSMRGHLRKPCLIRVNYTILEQTYEGYILDISTVGVFIETSESFSVGQEMTLAFSLPNHQQMFKLIGMIAVIGMTATALIEAGLVYLLEPLMDVEIRVPASDAASAAIM